MAARFTDAYVQPGETLDLPAPYDRKGGEGALIGNLFGVATVNVAASSTIAFAVEGVFRLDKTASQTFAVGANVYWDNTAKSVTAVTTGNTRIGVAAVAAASNDAQAVVRLNGAGAPTGA